MEWKRRAAGEQKNGNGPTSREVGPLCFRRYPLFDLLAFGWGFRRLRLLWFGLFGRLALGSGIRASGKVHPFEDGALAGVALALAQLNDAGIAAVAFFLARSNLAEEDFNGVLLVQARGGKAAVM